MKKKVLALFLAAAMTLSLAACGEEDGEDVAGGKVSQSESVVDSTGADAGKDGEVGSDGQPQSSEAGDEKDADAKVGSGEQPQPSEAGDEKDSGEAAGGRAPQGNPDVNPIEAALENVSAASSMEAQMIMEMDMEISAGGQAQSMDMVVEMDMSCFYAPWKLKAEMNMDIKGIGSQKMTTYADTLEDGSVMAYSYDGRTWQAKAVDPTDLNVDARRQVGIYFKDNVTYKEEGMEKINGVNAYKYSYAMNGEEMLEAMKASGSLDSLASSGIDESQMVDVMNGLSEVVAYIWVDEETLYPVRTEVDMTEVMSELMDSILNSMGGQESVGISIEVSKMKVSMTCSNFNHVADFEIPDEARQTY